MAELDQPINEQTPQATQTKETLDVLPSDEEIIRKKNYWLAESKTYYEALKEVQDRSEKYYLGDQTKRDLIPAHLSNFVGNRIFESAETILPIITSNPAEFLAKSPDNSELGIKRAHKVQFALSNIYEELNMSQKLEDASRFSLLYRFGILKFFWDDEKDNVGVKAVRPQRIRIPKFGRTAQDLPYLIEKMDMTYQEMSDFFGEDKAKEVLSSGTQSGDAEETKMDMIKRVWTIEEIWTNWWVAYTYQERVLKSEKNPYWKDSGNFFDKPRKPYAFISPFSLGKSPVAETSIVEQAIPIQDALNATARIIINHATKTANSPWLIDSSTMTKEEADSIRNEPGLVIHGSGVANPNLVRRDSPPPMPNYIFELWLSLNRSLDNLFGTHSTTRGEREGRETFRGRVLLKQADIGRLDYIVREIDRAVRETGEYIVQLIKLFYTDQRKIKVLGLEGIEEFEFSQEDVEDGLEIMVRSGSTLPKDEVSESDQALQLWQQGALDPITLYEKLRFPNPQQTAERLMKWKMGTLIPVQQPIQSPAPSPNGGVGGFQIPGAGATGGI